MKAFKKIIYSLGILLVLFAILGLWYKDTYSMSVIEAYHINSNKLSKRVLIVSQGSEFKNKVVRGIIHNFKSTHFEIIDVSYLDEVKNEKWDAIVLIHTWVMNKPPKSVKIFLERSKNDLGKIVIFTTSGSGNYKMKDVDAITGESIIEDVNKKVKEISDELIIILETKKVPYINSNN